MKTLAVLVLLRAAGAPAADWTGPVDVRHDFKPCVSYRARLDGEILVLQATHEPGWKTYAMDNKRRADEKLTGRQSLGLEAPTEITVTGGLRLAGPWRQSPPKDFSKPELQWFSWGFDGQALFVAKVRRAGAGPAQIAVRGQACTEMICKRVDVAISLPLPGAGARAAPSSVDLKSLVRVR